MDDVHTALLAWANEYQPFLRPGAFDELERRVMALVKAERERVAVEMARGFMEVGAEMDARLREMDRRD